MIPKIVHQVWDSKNERIPKSFKDFAATWKNNNSEWKYESWNKKRMDIFVRKFYPEFAPVYFGYKYDVQRWNVIRYLILYTFGGVYVDFDCECLKSIDEYLRDKNCIFGLEPQEHAKLLNKEFIVSNAFIASKKGHPFLQYIIEGLPRIESKAKDKVKVVMETSGVLMLTSSYESWIEKNHVYLFPSTYISPMSRREVQMYLRGEISEQAAEKKTRRRLCRTLSVAFMVKRNYPDEF